MIYNRPEYWLKEKEVSKPYLTFSSPSSFTLRVNDVRQHWNGTLEYSTDASAWSTWSGKPLSSATSGSDNVLYLRGTGNTVITGNSLNYGWSFTGSDISCIGNIENLLDYATVESGQHPTMGSYCYAYMFRGCTILTQAPTLPATRVAPYCYRSMFQGCSGLTQVPTLPSNRVETYCYAYMFNGCTSITQAPALLATRVATHCYRNMFQGCTSLVQIPALRATTLAQYCYRDMFNGCTSIKLSSTQTGEYTQEYRIPTTGTGNTASNALNNTFSSTGGTFTGTPSINKTYYLSNTNTIV